MPTERDPVEHVCHDQVVGHAYVRVGVRRRTAAAEDALDTACPDPRRQIVAAHQNVVASGVECGPCELDAVRMAVGEFADVADPYCSVIASLPLPKLSMASAEVLWIALRLTVAPWLSMTATPRPDLVMSLLVRLTIWSLRNSTAMARGRRGSLSAVQGDLLGVADGDAACDGEVAERDPGLGVHVDPREVRRVRGVRRGQGHARGGRAGEHVKHAVGARTGFHDVTRLRTRGRRRERRSPAQVDDRWHRPANPASRACGVRGAYAEALGGRRIHDVATAFDVGARNSRSCGRSWMAGAWARRRCSDVRGRVGELASPVDLRVLSSCPGFVLTHAYQAEAGRRDVRRGASCSCARRGYTRMPSDSHLGVTGCHRPCRSHRGAVSCSRRRPPERRGCASSSTRPAWSLTYGDSGEPSDGRWIWPSPEQPGGSPAMCVQLCGVGLADCRRWLWGPRRHGHACGPWHGSAPCGSAFSVLRRRPDPPPAGRLPLRLSAWLVIGSVADRPGASSVRRSPARSSTISPGC